MQNLIQETTEDVMFYDTDIGGVIHNLAYLKFIERNRTLLAGKLGMKLKEMADTRIFPVVVGIEVKYKKPGTLGDQILVKGWLDKVERARFWCCFEVCNQETQEALVTSRQSLAIIKITENNTSKPMRIPSNWQDLVNTK